MSKSSIRQEIALKRKTLTSQWIQANSLQVIKNIQSQAAFLAAQRLALYMAIGGEVDIEALFSLCWKQNKQTCIPIFNPTTQHYNLAEVSKSTQFTTGRYGIREPISPKLVSTDTLDLILVPGVAFDLQGNRLGRGGGYYDHLLKGFTGHTFGVAFDFQLRPSIPLEPHDQPVEKIITSN